jgi:nucleoside transporter
MSQAAMNPSVRLAGDSTGVFVRLCVMMFLEFFIWGAWYVTTGNFMTAAGMTAEIKYAYMLAPIAAIISPFFLGMIADRFFASERVLAVLHLLGGAAMLAVPMAARSGPVPFLAVVWIHTLCFMPTINLTNSIAFANLTDQEKQFPMIRVFGTLGWIAAGLLVSFMGVDNSATQYTITGACAILLAVFSLVLPHTPPPAKGKKATVGEILGLDALSLFKSRSFAVFAISSFLICIPLAAYYSYAARMVGDVYAARDAGNTTPPVGATMSVGQAAEVVFMLIMPFFFKRLGVKWMLALGMLAWVARYALFAMGAPQQVLWMIVLGIGLHGICYDFFFVTGFIYTDKRAPKRIRNQAQGLIVLLTYGLGLFIGAYITGELFNNIVGTATGAAALPLYQKFWTYPAVFALVIFVVFAVLFRDDSKDAPADEPEPQGFQVSPVVANADAAAAESAAPR